MKSILFLAISSIFFFGCGGGSSSSNSGGGSTPPVAPGGDVNMTISRAYTVSPGNKVVKTSTNARVKITHIEGGSTTIVLQEGTATILRKP